MPKPTFHHLPEERQKEILEIALQEFSVRSLHEASVGNITKQLGLSRASFYKYFENLEELYSYLYHQIARDSHDLLLESLKESDGDLFEGMKKYAGKMAEELFDSRYHSFYRTMLLKMDYRTLTMLEHTPPRETAAETGQVTFIEKLTANLNDDNLS